jgi:putative transposase
MKPKRESQQTFWQPQCYDPREEYTVVWRKLPHWVQAGTVSFVTWRTWDSMPTTVIRGWQAERDAWLRRHGIDPAMPGWEALVQNWPIQRVREFQRFLSDRWGKHLDCLHGECALRLADCHGIVAESLRHFDEDRYRLCDYVVMPNHVHLLAAFADDEAMLAQCESWKHYTARQINRILGRTGRFWEQDAFDHLVRSPDEFERLRRYIAENPRSAGLKPGEYVHYSKELPSA